MTPPFKTFPLSLRLVMIFGMFFFNMLIVTYLVSFVLHAYFGYNDPMDAGNTANLTPTEINSLLILQAFSTIGGFILTAMMFSVLETGEFVMHLGLKDIPSWKMLLLAIFSLLIAQFFISYLVDLNGKIPIPESVGPVLKDLQKKYDDITNAFFNFKSLRRLFIVSLVMAVLPAIAEEMFFRGLILGDMLKAKVRPAVAIMVSGLLFALIHFEFQNTLAIWVLGCFLGYLYYVSGSLWLSIAVHFANNFLDVLLKYLYNTGAIKTDISNLPVPIYLVVVSLALFALCLFIFNKWKVQPSFVEEELPNEDTFA